MEDHIKKLDATKTLLLVCGLILVYLGEVASSNQGIWMALGGLFLTVAIFDEIRLLRLKNPDPSKANPMTFPILVFLLVLLIFVPVFTASNAIRYFKAENNISYTVKKGEATVYRIYGGESTVVIAKTYKDAPITSIGKMAAFRRSEIESISFPEGLKKIENSAFMGCKNLTQVELPEGLEKLASQAFRNCKGLQRIYIPASVTSIPKNAFKGCPKDLVIVGVPGSAAQTFAEKYYTFEAQ